MITDTLINDELDLINLFLKIAFGDSTKIIKILLKENFENGKYSKNNNRLSKNALNDVTAAVCETKEQSLKNSGEIIKLKDNTVPMLIKHGVTDLPMMVKKGHLRNNILTKEEAEKLGYSIRKKNFHGLGVKKYLEIINSIDNPIGIYRYTKKGKYNEDNFIVLTSIKIDGNNVIVPIEINNKGTYNRVDIKYNRIKTVYPKENDSYLTDLISGGQIFDIKKEPCEVQFQHSPFDKLNISNNNVDVNKSKANYQKYNCVIEMNNKEINVEVICLH